MEMDWLQQNLDAYRIVAEILNALRAEVRRGLEAELGGDWHNNGLPAGVRDRLIERKEKEKAIDWHESEYQEITSFAGFADMLEILQEHPDLFPEFLNLASNPALLYARFLELEVIANKLGLARAIGESELTFLGTFHLRFQRALTEAAERRRNPKQSRSQAKTSEAAAEPAPDTEQQPAPPDDDQKPAADQRPAAEQVEFTVPEEQESPPPAKSEAATEAEPVAAGVTPPPSNVGPPQRPPMRAAVGIKTGGVRTGGSSTSAAVATAPAAAPASQAEPAGVVQRLSQALEKGDSQIILKELYREITSLAEGVWSSDVVPVPHVWNQVCSSSWYESSFSRLGLKPLSDFYAIINKVDERVQKGASRDQLQELLKENHFAQVLLLLRDMFQRNRI